METLNTLNRDTVVCYPWWELFVKSVNGWQLERGQQGTTRTRAGTQLATFWYIFFVETRSIRSNFFFSKCGSKRTKVATPEMIQRSMKFLFFSSSQKTENICALCVLTRLSSLPTTTNMRRIQKVF